MMRLEAPAIHVCSWFPILDVITKFAITSSEGLIFPRHTAEWFHLLSITM
jgi:hypothetical protein